MRWLLLIMTGIGFTLGLLCGLLLHLPADGLPATHSHGNDDGVSRDAAGRMRRSSGSLGDGAVNAGRDLKVGDGMTYDVVEPGKSRNEAGQRDGSSFQSPPNPQLDRGAGSSEAVAGQKAGARDSLPQQPPVPVTSFTLRLRMDGDKVVVMQDSAAQDHHPRHKRQQSDGSQDAARSATLSRGSQAGPLQANGSRRAEEVVKGVVWSQGVEEACSGSEVEEEAEEWRQKAVGMQVVGVEEGCGRMQNRLITFRDGSKACARYRLNTDQIQGEVYSYYLAQVLNMSRYLPPSVLVPVDTLGGQWRAVHLQLSGAQWADGRLVVLTRWLPDLAPAHIPLELREDDRALHPLPGLLANRTRQDLCELLQWSDLLVFDYLTANLDRLVNNMFNRQWNAEMMNNPAHNLERTRSGQLVFLDNESGLFHGYRLLDKYRGYHESLLNALCVFRRSTVAAVRTLAREGDVGRRLERLMAQGEAHRKLLPPMPEKNVDVLKERLARVEEQIARCEARYGGSDAGGYSPAGAEGVVQNAGAVSDVIGMSAGGGQVRHRTEERDQR